MKNAKSLLLSLLVASLASCKPPYIAPKIEKCIANGDGSAECADLRLPEERQVYHRPTEELENYICTNPHDEETIYNYCANLRQKLIECERN